MARANALLVIPEERARCEAGERVHALLVSDEAQLAEEFAL
jgi:molybdopterin biosynthesis enzyme